ncbi:MAG: HAD-IIB family hydrolase [Candidatus Micrarchaeia archaeon]
MLYSLDEIAKVNFAGKKVVVADLDGTLAESKTEVDSEMAGLIARLLESRSLAVISGAGFSQFQKQFIKNIKCDGKLLQRLYIFPTNAMALYIYEGASWKEAYAEVLNEEEKKKIFAALDIALEAAGYEDAKNAYGEIIEDRKSQVTFSGLGQNAPLNLKEKWDPDASKRIRIKRLLDPLLPEFEVRIGGTTSIDITRKGIDKAYGIGKIKEYLKVATSDIIYFGDALFAGGNDYPVIGTGVDCIEVNGVEDTKRVFRYILEKYPKPQNYAVGNQ